MKIKRTGNLLLLFLAVQLLLVGTAIAAPISKAEQEKKRAEEELKKVRQEIEELEKSKDAVLSEISDMDEKLSTLLITINVMEEDIADKKGEVSEAEADYREAYARERKQYEAMKKRIRYVYERGDISYLDILLKAESLEDAITGNEYISQLYDYDRTMFLDYKKVRDEVGEREKALEEEEAEMEVMEEEYRSERDTLERSIAVKKNSVENFDESLKNANDKAKEYASAVKEQTEKLRILRETQKKQAKLRAQSGKELSDRTPAGGQPSDRTPAGTGQTKGETGAATGPAAERKPVKSTGGTARGREIADYALQFVGNPYVWGGTSLTKGADCSGFTQSVYRHFGIKIPRTSAEQSKFGKKVKFEDLQSGDLVFYAGHVVMYIGDGRIVHASSKKEGIKVGNDVTYRTILDIRRPWDSE